MSDYVVAEVNGDFGIAHINANNRTDAAAQYVNDSILPGRDVSELDEIEIGVVLESHVKMFGIEPSFKII